jgi:hypothetical protein
VEPSALPALLAFLCIVYRQKLDRATREFFPGSIQFSSEPSSRLNDPAKPTILDDILALE